MSGEEFPPAAGPLAPPMDNGEVVFEFPWQGRIFGMAVALAEAGAFHWEEFRQRLIAELAAVEVPDPAGGTVAGGTDGFAYYEHFQRALERLLMEKGLVVPDRLDEVSDALAARPHGHDHHHHDHHHGVTQVQKRPRDQ